MSKFMIEERNGDQFEADLPGEFKLKQWSTADGLWKAKLWAFLGTRYADWLSLTERSNGAIQFSDGDAKRVTTGTKTRVDAISFGVARLHDRHMRQRTEGDPLGVRRPSTAGDGLRLRLVADLLLRENLLAPPEVSPREAKRILKGVRGVTEVLGGDLDVMRMNQSDVNLYYAKACGCKLSGIELTDAELKAMGLSEADLGATLDGRPRRSKHRLRTRGCLEGLISPSTAHNDLNVLCSALSKLVGASDKLGVPFLSHNRLLQLNLGRGPGKQTEALSRERFEYIVRYADRATEEWNRRKRENAGFIREGGRSSVHGVLRQVPIGAVRCIMVVAWHRAVRHQQILGLNVEDHLTTKRAIKEAIRNSRPSPGQAKALPEWAEIWHKHGALFFAMEYAQKPGFDRVCPNCPRLEREMRHYRDLRRDQGLPDSGPLFRYLSHGRRLDAAVVREIIVIAEDLARDECIADGCDPEEVFCSGVRPLHDARTAVSNRWQAMGWEHNKNAAWLGCWSTNIPEGNAADAVYKKLNPHLVMALAMGMDLLEAISATGVANTAKAEVLTDLPF